MTDVLAPAVANPRSSVHDGSRPPQTSLRRNRRRLAVVCSVAVVVLVGEAVLGGSLWRSHATLARDQHALARIQRRLRATDSRLAARRVELAGVRRDLTARTGERDAAAAALVQAQQDLGVVKVGVANVGAQATANGGQIGALSTCLGGAQQAVFHIDAGDTTSAVAALRAVQSACDRALTAAGGDGPVFPFDFADPFVLRVGDVYYAYSTNAGAGNIQVIRSTDLRHWELLGNALPSLPAWATPNATWAPAVLARTGFYVVYYTAPDAAAGLQCISSAVSFAPQGPYLDTSTAPLVCQHDLGGSIDPSPFVDAQGHAWLLWRSQGGGSQRATIWSAPLTADGRGLAGSATALIEADQRWERGVVEAPAMVPEGAGEALFYSGNDWNSRHYAIGRAQCAAPAGPCTKPGRAPVLTSHDAVAGPGGAELFTDPSGAQWMAYHAFAEPHVGYPASRLLRLARVRFVGGHPIVTPPPW